MFTARNEVDNKCILGLGATLLSVFECFNVGLGLVELLARKVKKFRCVLFQYQFQVVPVVAAFHPGTCFRDEVEVLPELEYGTAREGCFGLANISKARNKSLNSMPCLDGQLTIFVSHEAPTDAVPLK